MTAAPPNMTATPQGEASLRAALGGLRVEGAIFLRAEYSESWGFESPDAPTAAAMLKPGTSRLVFFHVVASGRCHIVTADGEPHWADAGDVIVVPYGDQHAMGGVEPAERVPVGEILPPPPWDELPIVRHGAGGRRTDIVCGYIHCEDPLFDPGLRAFPSAFVVRPRGPAAKWVEASVDYALEGASDPAATRIPELLLLEVLGIHLASAPAAERGWLAALRDPVLAPAIAELHTRPEHKWTVAELASEAAVSRSVLDERFRQVLGRSPIRYLTEWRMHLAEEMLAGTLATVATVARQVGYDSEEAFSRAFKRAHGVSPLAWRTARVG